jgi:hypothetical protein
MENDAGTDRVVRVLAEYLQANPPADYTTEICLAALRV